MKESIGSTFTYNLIILFIAIVFAILGATLLYYKAYKVNTRIINSIEKFEGYNSLANAEINSTLTSLGYMTEVGKSCPAEKNGGTLVEQDTDFRYCVYYFQDDEKHYSYGVMTYITIDIPVVNTFLQIPIYTKSNLIYKFTD